MDFELTKEQIDIRRHVREFMEREVEPMAQQNDRDCKFDWNIAKKRFSLRVF